MWRRWTLSLDHKRMQLVYEVILLNKILRNHLLFQKYAMKLCIIQRLPLIISCRRSWNFAWQFLWRSTSERKNIVKLLAISQTIYTMCCEDDYLNCFSSLFFIVDLFAVHLLQVVCNEDKCCVVTQRAAGLFTFVCIVCLLQLWIKTCQPVYSIWARPK